MVFLTEVDMAIGYTPSGYHVRACCLELPGIMTISRDAVGNITSLKGISAEMLDWMSLAFNFTIECVNVNVSTIENTTTTLGSIHYATHDVCEVIVAPTILRYERFKFLDFIHPWLIEPVAMLIPMPVFVSDPLAFLEPFSLTVWMLILFSILAMTALLMLLDYSGPTGCDTSRAYLHWLFVIGSLFGRGGFWVSKKIRIRILMAVLLVGAFVLVVLYTSELFGYLLTTIPEPIVKSAKELAEKPNVDLLVVNHLAIDIIISKSGDSLMKKLAQKLDKNTELSRCPNVKACMERVKKSKRPSVFIQGIGPLSNMMVNDFRETGQCNFALTQESFIDSLPGSWMVRKGDRNFEFYNKATMRMHESGLLNYWHEFYQPKPYECLQMSKQKGNDPRSTAKITLKNLAIPFAMLAVGFILAFFILICERCLLLCGFKKIETTRS